MSYEAAAPKTASESEGHMAVSSSRDSDQKLGTLVLPLSQGLLSQGAVPRAATATVLGSALRSNTATRATLSPGGEASTPRPGAGKAALAENADQAEATQAVFFHNVASKGPCFLFIAKSFTCPICTVLIISSLNKSDFLRKE